MRRFYTGAQDILFGIESNFPNGKVIFDDLGEHRVTRDGDGEHHFTTTILMPNEGALKLTFFQAMGINLETLPSDFGHGTLVLFGSLVHDHKFRKVDELIMRSMKRKNKAKLSLVRNKEHPGRAKYRQRAHAEWLEKLPKVISKYGSSKFIWVTSPFYETFKLRQISEAAAINQNNARYLKYNLDGVREVLKLNGGGAFLDAFHLTKACVFANCSEDGAHRARFVNRMKFQIVLNHLCASQMQE